MSRCAVCDHMEGHYSPTTPYVNRYTHSRTRWRKEFSEYQCDDCYSSIKSVYPIEHVNEEEGEVEHVIELNEDDAINKEIPTAAITPPVSEPEV